jgi:hypothetical protein
MEQSTIVVPLAAAIVGAVLVALIQPAWTLVIGRKSRLHVSVRLHSFQMPRFLKEDIRSYLYAFDARVRPTEPRRELLQNFLPESGYTILKISNRSRSLIRGVSVRLDNNNNEFFADVSLDGSDRPSEDVRTLNVGDLHPNSICKIDIWTFSDYAEKSFGNPATRFIVSANDYDAIKYNICVSDYIVHRYFLLRKRYGWISFWVFLIVFNVLVQVLARLEPSN